MELENGFLDLKINESISIFREEYKSEYLLILKIKSFLEEVQNCFADKTVSNQDMYLFASIVELGKLFQSAVLLFERGLPESANIIVRSILELNFEIIESIRNADFLKEMILNVNSETLVTLKKIKKKELYDLIPQKHLDDLLNKCQQSRSKSEMPDVKASKLAERNGLEKEYILYRMCCDYTHQSIKVIDEIVEVMPGGVHLNGDLRLDDFAKSIAMLGSITMISFPKIVQHSLIDENLKHQLGVLQDDFANVFK